MTEQEGIDKFRELVNEKNTSVVTDAIVRTYIQSGLNRVNDICGYWIETFKNTDVSPIFTLVAGTAEYNLPSNIIAPIFFEFNGKLLSSTDFEILRKDDMWVSKTPDVPHSMMIYGNKFLLHPAPKVVSGATWTLRAVCTPPSFDTDAFSGLQSQHHEVPIYWAAAEFLSAHGRDANFARAEKFKEMFMLAVGNCRDYYDRRRTVFSRNEKEVER